MKRAESAEVTCRYECTRGMNNLKHVQGQRNESMGYSSVYYFAIVHVIAAPRLVVQSVVREPGRQAVRKEARAVRRESRLANRVEVHQKPPFLATWVSSCFS